MRMLVLMLGLALSHTARAASPCDDGTFVGDLEVSPDTVDGLAAVRCVVGHLTLTGSGPLVWPTLWRTFGRVTIAGTRLTEVVLPDLDEAWQHLTVEDNPELRRLDFPRFGSLNARAVIRRNPALSEIRWDALGALNGVLEVADNAALTTVDLSALGAVNGRLAVTANPALTTLDLASLGSVLGRLTIVDNPALPTCDVEDDLGPLLAPGLGRLVVVSGNGSCILEAR